MKAVEQVGAGVMVRRRPRIEKGRLVSDREQVPGPFRGLDDWARWCVTVDGKYREAICLEGAGQRLLPVAPERLGPRWRNERIEEIVGLSEAAWERRALIRAEYQEEIAEAESEVRAGESAAEILVWVQGDSIRRRGGEWDTKRLSSLREAGRVVVAIEAIGEVAVSGAKDGRIVLERIGRGHVGMWVELAGIVAERRAFGSWVPGAGRHLQAVSKKVEGRISDDEADELEGRLRERIEEADALLGGNWEGVERVARLLKERRDCTAGEVVGAYRNSAEEVSLLELLR